jgi:hypothetical protein
MITCAHCYKMIERPNPRFCCRCGYRVVQESGTAFAAASSPAGITPGGNSLLEMLQNSKLSPEAQAKVLKEFEPILKAVEEKHRPLIDPPQKITAGGDDSDWGIVLRDESVF